MTAMGETIHKPGQPRRGDGVDCGGGDVCRFRNDDEFNTTVVEFIAKQIYEKARGGEAA